MTERGEGLEPSRHERAFRVLLALLPRLFRERYAEEMTDLFLRRLARARQRGWRAIVSLWIRGSLDVSWTACTERVGMRRSPASQKSGRGEVRGRPSPLRAVAVGIRHAARSLRRSPAFTAVAVATLGIGIGATTVGFAVVNGVLLRPLGYPEEHELVSVVLSAPGINQPRMASAPFLHFAYQEESRTFESVALWRSQPMTVTGQGRAEQTEALVVTSGLLATLGVAPSLGRDFVAEDDAPGAPATTILTDGYFELRFGGDPAVLGQTLVLNGRSHRVVGVLPETFRFLDRDVDLLVPAQLDRARVWLGGFGAQSIARLRQGATFEEASADVARILPIAIGSTPPPAGVSREQWAERLRLEPNLRHLRADVVGNVGGVIWPLMGAVGLMLVIACANVANLLLVRFHEREEELSVHAALGAGRARILLHVALQGLLLGAFGGLVGIALAYWGLPALVSMAPDTLPRTSDVHVDLGVIVFALAASALTGLLLGLIPAVRYAALPGRGGHHRSGRGATASVERQRILGGLVVVQVALSLVLLIGSGLMVRTYRALGSVDPGFVEPEDVRTLRIAIPEGLVSDPAEVGHMQEDISSRLTAISGVRSAGLGSSVPPELVGRPQESVLIQGREYSDDVAPTLRRFEFVSPGFLETLGTRMVAGRAVNRADMDEGRPVAMVSEALAREEWGSPEAALGRRVRTASDEPWRDIVGVVQDVRGSPYDPTSPTVYLPLVVADFWGSPTFAWRTTTVAVRESAAGGAGLLEQAREAIGAVSADIPVSDVRTLSEIYGERLGRFSFTLTLLVVASVVSFFLGIFGVYGVLAYAVSQRRREIGVRSALGASPGTLRRMLARRGVFLAGIGVAAGLVIAIGVTRLLSSLLFQTSPTDPLTFMLVSAAFALAAAVAVCAPALKATRASASAALTRS